MSDDLPVGVWIARAPGGELVHANRAFAEIMGMTARADVAVGEYAAPYGIHTRSGALYPEHDMPFVRALRAGTTVVVDDIVIHRRDGGRVYIRATAKPVVGTDGATTHVVIAFIDITREVEADEARSRSERELAQRARLESVGKVARAIAHDFNNLLSVIRGVASGLAKELPDPSHQADLALIEEAVTSGAAMTRALLDYARQRPLALAPLLIDEPIRRALGMVERMVDPRVVLESELGARRAVMGDAGMLEQVVMNLAINACEAMPDGGRLTVRTYDDAAAHEVVLEVEDTGGGIEPDILPRLFEPYVTTKASPTRRGGGVGLATVHGIVETHRGAIAVVKSDASGTLFRARLPAVAGAAAP